jgi:hypothetical protein
MDKDLPSVQNLIEKKLQEISKEGRFDLLVLFSEEGLPMIQIPSSKYDKEDFVALSILINDLAKVAEALDSSLKVDETSIMAHNKYKIVGRIFHVNGMRFNLVAIVPPEVAYRKFINKAVKTLSAIL